MRFLSRELDDRLDAARDGAGRLRRRRRRRPGLRHQRDQRREHRAALARARRPATSCSPPTTLQRVPQRARATWPSARGARVVVAPLPFPLGVARRGGRRGAGPVTPRTRLALLDHVTSPTGLVLPIERLIAELSRARHRRARRRRARARDAAPRSRRARRRVLQRQLPQVALRAQGLRVPVGAPRSPSRGPAADDQPRRHRARPRPLALPPRVRLDGHQRSDRLAHRAEGDRVRRRARCRAAGPR